MNTSLAGMPVWNLRPEDRLIILCMHGSRHQWARLSWLCDIAMLVEKYPELNWEEIEAIAQHWGSQRMLYLGLHLAHILLEVSLPKVILRYIEADSAVAQLRREVCEQRFSICPSQRFLASTRYQIQVRERWKDKAACAQSLIHWLMKGRPSEHHVA